LHSTRSVAPLAWALLAAGFIAATTAGLVCKPAWERKSELAQERIQLQEELARLGAGPARAPRVRDRVGSQEAAELVDQIRRPWHQLFDQIETAQTPDVHLVQLNVDSHFASLQLVAEGRELDKLVRFAQRLAGTGPIRTMAMTHQEWRDALGAHVVSASLQGELAPTWSAPGATGATP